jgi:thioredoxin reductase (NADPH)
MSEANAGLGVQSLSTSVTALAPKGGRHELSTDDGIVRAKAVVLATGARMRSLGVPGEDRFEHRGVSHCADCDGPLCQGKPAVVVGGGDSACMQAAVLADYASEVIMVLRGERPRARAELVDAVARNERIHILSRSQVLEVLGQDGVSSVRIATDGAEQVLPCAGLFIYAGLQANSELVRPHLGEASHDGVATDADLRTALPSLYAIGAVRAGYSGRLADAVAEAARAAEHAARHLPA